MKLELFKEQDAKGDVFYIVSVDGMYKHFYVGNVFEGINPVADETKRKQAEAFFEAAKKDVPPVGKTLLKSEEI